MLHSKYSGLVLNVARQRGGAEPGVVTLLDHSRYGNDGAMTDITWAQLPSGLWVPNFNGTSSIVNCGNAANLANLPALTAIAWINPPTAGENTLGHIVHKAVGVGPTAGWVFMLLGVGGAIRFKVNFVTQDLRKVSVAATIVFSSWQQVAVTWGGSDNHAGSHIYRNGAEVIYDASLNGVGARVDDVASNLNIGNDSTSVRTFDGFIGMVQIYNYALTPAQVRSRYSATRRLFGV